MPDELKIKLTIDIDEQAIKQYVDKIQNELNQRM
jgi:hypothetical protein